MSTVLILAPVIIANWPAITAAAVAAAAATGLVAKDTAKGILKEEQQVEHAEMELAGSNVISQNIATEKELVFTSGTVEIKVKKDNRGRCVVCAEGVGQSKAQLRQIAENFCNKLTQHFVYNKVMTELRQKGFQIVNQETMNDEAVRIHVRRWAD
jgi:translation initiation factor 1 (eIF-1/SUI1)